MSTYLFEHTWDEERRRLDLLEAVFDPGTHESLGRVPGISGRVDMDRLGTGLAKITIH